MAEDDVEGEGDGGGVGDDGCGGGGGGGCLRNIFVGVSDNGEEDR